MNRHLASGLLALPLLPSCASIIAKSPKLIEFDSSPSNVRFSTNYGESGTTPAILSPPSDFTEIVVTFRDRSADPQTFTLKKRMSYWIAGNLLFGGIIGIAIDLVNPGACVWPGGGDWNVTLEPKSDEPMSPRPRNSEPPVFERRTTSGRVEQ